MAVVKVFKAARDLDFWRNTIEWLEENGVRVYSEYSPADVSFVLSGRLENPTILKGRKILFHDSDEWQRDFSIYQFVLEEYYNDFIDLKGLDSKQKADRIVKHIDEIKKS